MTAARSFLGRLARRVGRWTARPPIGGVSFGSLRRLDPVNRRFGLGRGTPVDRYYIERFLDSVKDGIRGRVLEVGDNAYTMRFGGARVVRSDVLHAEPGHPGATIVGDLTRSEQIPSDAYDCVICTQTLPFIYEVREAVRTLYRILKPGGVLLATVPGISQISRYDMERWGDYWRFTTLSTRRLILEHFPDSAIEIRAHGNVLASVAFLHGLAAEELTQPELDHADPDFETLITVRATKPGAPRA
ncbi:MAG: methyltransferase domain-containing protein [Candidatus Latescibacteria bacterium]|nr:methyltransferase domain-containing protein [Candidatus Latescibacterota bacterium]